MNEFKRCINVFSHSPFKVRLMLIGMLCEMINGKPQQGNCWTVREEGLCEPRMWQGCAKIGLVNGKVNQT